MLFHVHIFSHPHLTQHSKLAIIITQAKLIMDETPFFILSSTKPAEVTSVVTYASGE